MGVRSLEGSLGGLQIKGPFDPYFAYNNVLC